MCRQTFGAAFFSAYKIIFLVFMGYMLVSFFVVSVNCESETLFTVDDVFDLSSNNSSIRFASNGTYETAFLENNTWFFDGLYFDLDVISAQKLNISITARDCNVTIIPFFAFTRASEEDSVTRIFFRYLVEGQGTQAVNLGFDLHRGQIEAILDGEWTGLNHGWSRSFDGTVTVTAPVSNVTISFYGHPESYLDEPDLLGDHFVVIASSFSFVVIAVLATIFQLKKGTGEP